MADTPGQVWSRAFTEKPEADVLMHFLPDIPLVVGAPGVIRAWCDHHHREVRDWGTGTFWFDATPEECAELLELILNTTGDI